MSSKAKRTPRPRPATVQSSPRLAQILQLLLKLKIMPNAYRRKIELAKRGSLSTMNASLQGQISRYPGSTFVTFINATLKLAYFHLSNSTIDSGKDYYCVKHVASKIEQNDRLGEYQNGTDRVVCNKDDEDKIVFRQKYPIRKSLAKLALEKHVIRRMICDKKSGRNPPIMVRKRVVCTEAMK
uniref:Uncharacterized protein n=1 Tax=Glossina austeni TaxID=7395 RepID=A0A1A9VBX4_GLOAU